MQVMDSIQAYNDCSNDVLSLFSQTGCSIFKAFSMDCPAGPTIGVSTTT